MAMRLALHTLWVSDLERSLAFYGDRFGMQLQGRSDETAGARVRQARLAFPTAGSEPQRVTQLQLLQSSATPGAAPKSEASMSGYWKIGVTLANVDAAAERLRAAGIAVSQPRQFRDIGYLCHLTDPDGHTIELLQHTFGPAEPATAGGPLAGPGRFGQITLRIKDPDASLRFYRDALGMRLLSRQQVEPHRFTLYFLAFTDETPPVADVDAVANREWLWQRPYTTLELQHRWGTEDGDFAYRVGADTGLDSFSIATADIDGLAEALAAAGFRAGPGAAVADPDGYRVCLVSP